MDGQKGGIKGYKSVVNGEGRKTRSSCVRIKSERDLKDRCLLVKQKQTFLNTV